MKIDSKKSTFMQGKMFDMHEGVGGNGSAVYEIYTIVDGICTHLEQFKTKLECISWWKNACN